MNTEVKNWLARAKSNLEFAKDAKRDNFTCNGGYIFIEEVCYELQQSVEKSLKALLIFHQIIIPHSHNIAELLSKLKENDILIPEEIFLSKKLTDYAVETRYPHYDEPLQEEDYNEALEIAQNVYNWVEKQVI
jgi:HEPN domain-containing protein